MPKIVFDPDNVDIDALRNSAVVVHYHDGSKLVGHVSGCISQLSLFYVTDKTGKIHDLDLAAIRNGDVIVVFDPADKFLPDKEEEGLHIDMFG